MQTDYGPSIQASRDRWKVQVPSQTLMPCSKKSPGLLCPCPSTEKQQYHEPHLSAPGNHNPQMAEQGAGLSAERPTKATFRQLLLGDSCLGELIATHGANLPTQEAPGASSPRKWGGAAYPPQRAHPQLVTMGAEICHSIARLRPL